MLTRHLYSLDEVVAALQLCLRFRRNDEASFWIWELVRSHEIDLAHATLKQTWLDFGGGWFADTILESGPPPASDTTAWLNLLNTVVQAIENAGTASSVPLMCCTAAQPQRPCVTPLKGLRVVSAAAKSFAATLDEAEGMTRDQAGLWFVGLATATKPQDVAWLLQAVAPILSADATWAALESIAVLKAKTLSPAIRTAATSHPVSQMQYQVTAAMILWTPVPATVECRPNLFSWDEYDANQGRRKARRYPIPLMALHAGTTRGQLPTSETNLDEIRDPVPYLPEGCAYWRTVLQATKGLKIKNGAIVFANAETKESFYTAPFPDDLPDEWSADDQQKSHGAGCAESAPAPPPVPPVREESVTDLDAALTIHLS
jgi:hypothetical protein